MRKHSEAGVRQCTAAAGQQKVIAAEGRVAIVPRGIEKIARIE